MESHRRTEITIETKTITVIRTRHTGDHIFCSRCSAIVLPMTLAEDAEALSSNPNDVLRLLESDKAHAVQSGVRILKICGDSIKLI